MTNKKLCIKDKQIKDFVKNSNTESFRTFLIKKAKNDFNDMIKEIKITDKNQISELNKDFFKHNMQETLGKELEFNEHNLKYNLTNSGIIKIIDVVIPQKKTLWSLS